MKRYLEYRSKGDWVREGYPLPYDYVAYAESRAETCETKTRVVEVVEKVVYKSTDYGKQAVAQREKERLKKEREN